MAIKYGSGISCCKVCNTQFKYRKDRSKGIYCSRVCSDNDKKKLVTCEICGKDFYKYKYRIDKKPHNFCNPKCYQEWCKDFGGGYKIFFELNKTKSLNSLEIKGREIIDSLNIDYQEQFPFFDRYIVDIFIPSKNIIIEFDGYYHTLPERIKSDKKRDLFFMNKGYKILRYSEEQILKYPDLVKSDILNNIQLGG